MNNILILRHQLLRASLESHSSCLSWWFRDTAKFQNNKNKKQSSISDLAASLG
ncbi:hypothetical protein YC2023_028040 [Brassica napus]